MEQPTYGAGQFWDRRYSEGVPTQFEWFFSYPALRNLITGTLGPVRHLPCLHVGCGNSTLQEGMVALDGFAAVHNIDVSSVVISQMQEQHGAVRPELSYAVMDCRDMSALPDASFGSVLDKGTLDAVLCSAGGLGDTAKYLAEVYRLLVPGGVFLLISLGMPAQRASILEKALIKSNSGALQDSCNGIQVLLLPKPAKYLASEASFTGRNVSLSQSHAQDSKDDPIHAEGPYTMQEVMAKASAPNGSTEAFEARDYFYAYVWRKPGAAPAACVAPPMPILAEQAVTPTPAMQATQAAAGGSAKMLGEGLASAPLMPLAHPRSDNSSPHDKPRCSTPRSISVPPEVVASAAAGVCGANPSAPIAAALTAGATVTAGTFTGGMGSPQLAVGATRADSAAENLISSPMVWAPAGASTSPEPMQGATALAPGLSQDEILATAQATRLGAGQTLSCSEAFQQALASQWELRTGLPSEPSSPVPRYSEHYFSQPQEEEAPKQDSHSQRHHSSEPRAARPDLTRARRSSLYSPRSHTGPVPTLTDLQHAIYSASAGGASPSAGSAGGGNGSPLSAGPGSPARNSGLRKRTGAEMELESEVHTLAP